MFIDGAIRNKTVGEEKKTMTLKEKKILKPLMVKRSIISCHRLPAIWKMFFYAFLFTLSLFQKRSYTRETRARTVNFSDIILIFFFPAPSIITMSQVGAHLIDGPKNNDTADVLHVRITLHFF